MKKKLFTYEEAVALLPSVQELTEAAVTKLDEAGEEGDAHEQIVSQWAAELIALGIEVKGLWLVDFDSGSGYYCWRYPETSLQYFHTYEEGFEGRVKLN